MKTVKTIRISGNRYFPLTLKKKSGQFYIEKKGGKKVGPESYLVSNVSIVTELLTTIPGSTDELDVLMKAYEEARCNANSMPLALAM